MPIRSQEEQRSPVSSRRALLKGAPLGAAAMLLGSTQNANATECTCPIAGVFNVRDYGAKGDGTDDTAAIQAAIAAARAAGNAIVYFPPANPSSVYSISSPLVITGPLKIVGAGPTASTIWAQNFSSGQFVFDFDCVVSQVVQHIEISGLAVRSNNQLANGIRLKNAAYVLLKNVLAYHLYDGVVLTGTGTYLITFEEFSSYDCAHFGVLFSSASGGTYSFVSCDFTLGNTGVFIDGTSGVSGVSFVNCNFEQMTLNSFYAGGDVFGLAFTGCRTEGCNGDDFQINPVTGKLVAGLVIHGCHFTTDSGSAVPVKLGGAGGKVRGFNICGNYVGYAGNVFVNLNGDGESGLISGNYFSGASMTPTNTTRAGVHAFGNENATGKSPDI